MQGESLRRTTGYAVRVSVMYGALFSVLGIQLPFLAVWLEAQGLTATGIGLVMALPAVLRLLANPLIAMAADQRDAHATAVMMLSTVALVAAVVLLMSPPWQLMAVGVAILLVALQSTMPLIEVIAMRGVRRLGLDYGRLRLWGSITFIVGTVGGGWAIEQAGIGIFPMLVAATAALTLGAARLLPRRDAASASVPRDMAGIPSPAPSNGLFRGANRKAIRQLLASRDLVVFLMGASLIQASHATYYAFSAIHWGRLGISGETIGLLWAIGVIAEIVLFAFSRRIVGICGASGLLAFGALGGLVRWSAMTFDPVGGWLAGLQMLHALTFGATHLAAMHFIAERVPDEQAGLAQALFATFTSGIVMAAGLYLAGLLYGAYAEHSYWAMAAAAACGLLAAGLTSRRARA